MRSKTMAQDCAANVYVPSQGFEEAAKGSEETLVDGAFLLWQCQQGVDRRWTKLRDCALQQRSPLVSAALRPAQ